jgi:hypothetical protein
MQGAFPLHDMAGEVHANPRIMARSATPSHTHHRIPGDDYGAAAHVSCAYSDCGQGGHLQKRKHRHQTPTR